MTTTTLAERIATTAITAIRDIAVAVAGAEVGDVIDSSADTSNGEPSNTSPEPVKRRGRPRKTEATEVAIADEPAAVEQPAVVEEPVAPAPPAVVEQAATTNPTDADSLFGDDEVTQVDETPKSPKALREEVGGMIVQLVPVVGKPALGQLLAKYGVKMPKELSDDKLPAIHAELTKLKETTANPGVSI